MEAANTSLSPADPVTALGESCSTKSGDKLGGALSVSHDECPERRDKRFLAPPNSSSEMLTTGCPSASFRGPDSRGARAGLSAVSRDMEDGCHGGLVILCKPLILVSVPASTVSWRLAARERPLALTGCTGWLCGFTHEYRFLSSGFDFCRVAMAALPVKVVRARRRRSAADDIFVLSPDGPTGSSMEVFAIEDRDCGADLTPGDIIAPLGEYPNASKTSSSNSSSLSVSEEPSVDKSDRSSSPPILFERRRVDGPRPPPLPPILSLRES